jgi:hypothetical protein
MSIVLKKIGNKEYAYRAYRVGEKVVQKYLGPSSSANVMVHKARVDELKRVPERFRSLFWDVDPSTMDLKSHSRYIIERVLEIGDLDAMFWLQMIYPTRHIIDVCEESRKVSAKSRNFWNIWFGPPHAQ